jgi:hypothetical protein
MVAIGPDSVDEPPEQAWRFRVRDERPVAAILGSPTAHEPVEEAAPALRRRTTCLLPLELGQLILVQRGLALLRLERPQPPRLVRMKRLDREAVSARNEPRHRCLLRLAHVVDIHLGGLSHRVKSPMTVRL